MAAWSVVRMATRSVVRMAARSVVRVAAWLVVRVAAWSVAQVGAWSVHARCRCPEPGLGQVVARSAHPWCRCPEPEWRRATAGSTAQLLAQCPDPEQAPRGEFAGPVTERVSEKEPGFPEPVVGQPVALSVSSQGEQPGFPEPVMGQPVALSVSSQGELSQGELEPARSPRVRQSISRRRAPGALSFCRAPALIHCRPHLLTRPTARTMRDGGRPHLIIYPSS